MPFKICRLFIKKNAFKFLIKIKIIKSNQVSNSGAFRFLIKIKIINSYQVSNSWTFRFLKKKIKIITSYQVSKSGAFRFLKKIKIINSNQVSNSGPLHCRLSITFMPIIILTDGLRQHENVQYQINITVISLSYIIVCEYKSFSWA